MNEDFLRDAHVNFFLYHIKILPQPYEDSMNTNRMTVLYFSLVGLDMLDALDKVDKKKVIDWVYAMQVLPTGQNNQENDGRCGFRGSLFGGAPYCSEGSPCCHHYDSSHLAMTYTSLCILITLGDDLSRVHKKEIVGTLKQLQLENGSFTSIKDGPESDTRFVYCAAAISYMLEDFSGIDIPKATDFLKKCLNYDGGFGLNPGRESHGGSIYTSLASLIILGQKDQVLVDEKANQNLLRFCLNRVTEGFNGRPNKLDDTCYTFWVGGSVALLGYENMANPDQIKKFLLQTQKHTGGFSKLADVKADILHGFYGVAGWGLIIDKERKDIKNPIHPLLAISERAFNQKFNKTD